MVNLINFSLQITNGDFFMAKFGEKITTLPIVREKGYLYYIGKDGFPYRSPMARRGKKK
jgi:hypothetical protein